MMRYIFVLLTFLSFHLANPLFAQNDNVGIGTSSPAASARLDIESPNQGLLIPRLSSDARNAIAAPAPGLLVYDTDKRTIYLFEGQQWLPFAFATDSNSLPPTERSTGSITTSLGYALDMDSIGIVSSTDDGRVFFLASDNGNYANIEEIISSSADPLGEKFGQDVAVAGEWLAVGAPGGAGDSSKVYIFEREAGTWVERQILKNSTYSEINSGFGHSLAMSGNHLVVGSPFNDPFSNADEGAFFTYTLTGSSFALTFFTIQQTGTGFAPGDYFGWDVDITDEYIIVGAPGHDNREGKVFYYRIVGNTLTLDYQRVFNVSGNSVDQFYGYSVAIHPNGAVIGHPGGTSNNGGFHLIGNFGGPAFGDESIEFEQIFNGGGSGGSTFAGASVAIGADHVIIGFPNKINALFSTAENLSGASRALIYSYELSNGVALGQNLLQSWDADSVFLNGLGISTATWEGRVSAGHDEDNKLYIKDFREE